MQVNGNGDISIEIGAYSKSAAENISQLTASLKELKSSASGSGRSMSTLAKRLSEVVTAANKLSGSAKKLKAISEVFNSISNLGQTKISKNLGENLTSVADAAKGLDDSSLAKLDKLTTSLQKLSGVDINGVKTVMQESAQATSFANAISQKSGKTTASPIDAAKFEKELRRIDSSILRTQKNIEKFNEELERQQGLENADEQNVKGINSALEQETEILNRLLAQREKLFETGGAENFAKSVDKASASTSKFSRRLEKLVSAFKRIVFYRVVRTIIKEIGDAFREGTQNLYYYSQSVNGQFAKSMDTMATSMLYLKNSIGAAVAPIINALAPAIDFLADKVVSLINFINQLVAKLTGAKTWTKALKYQKAYADAVDGTGKAAKEALRYLAPFDELNVLSSENSSGSNKAAENYAAMFEEVALSNESLSWRKIGENIWDEIEKVFTNQSAANDVAKKMYEAIGYGLGAGVGLLAGFVSGVVDSIKKYFKNAIKDENGDGKFGGEEIIKGIIDGMTDGILKIPQFIKDNITQPIVNGFSSAFGIEGEKSKVANLIGSAIGDGIAVGIAEAFPPLKIALHFAKFIEAVKNIFGIHSPSTVFADIGRNVVQGFWNGIKEVWDRFSMWWKNLELQPFKIKTPHLSWTSQPASGWISNVLSALGLPTSIPKLDVNWYAQGGVFDKASLIGVGEAGKEAVVPLERNTEWIGKIASQLDRQMGGSSHMASDLEDANGVVVEAIFSATADIVKAISKNNGGGQSGSIDIERIARDVTSWQRRAARANG